MVVQTFIRVKVLEIPYNERLLIMSGLGYCQIGPTIIRYSVMEKVSETLRIYALLFPTFITSLLHYLSLSLSHIPFSIWRNEDFSCPFKNHDVDYKDSSVCPGMGKDREELQLMLIGDVKKLRARPPLLLPLHIGNLGALMLQFDDIAVVNELQWA